MAQVQFSTVVLNLASDLSQRLVLQFVTQINPAPQTPGEDRVYGNARFRAVSTGATQKQHAIAAQALEPAELATLTAWAGVTAYGQPNGAPVALCYRDDSGEKYYGTIRSPQITRHQFDPNADVSFTFTETTFDETVSS